MNRIYSHIHFGSVACIGTMGLSFMIFPSRHVHNIMQESHTLGVITIMKGIYGFLTILFYKPPTTSIFFPRYIKAYIPKEAAETF